MFGSHFNKEFLLVALFMKLFITIINPLARKAIFRVDVNHVKASTTTWSSILHVTFLMVFASIINTPSSRQAFIRESNQCKAAVFTFWPLTLQVALGMVRLKTNHKILIIRFILECNTAGLLQVEMYLTSLNILSPFLGGRGGG